MASRRHRIKDIANIPQRRRATAVGVTVEKQKEEIIKTDDKANIPIVSEQRGSSGTEKSAPKDVEELKTRVECTDLENENVKKQDSRDGDIIDEEEIVAYVRKPEEVLAISDLKKETDNCSSHASIKVDILQLAAKDILQNENSSAAHEGEINIVDKPKEVSQDALKNKHNLNSPHEESVKNTQLEAKENVSDENTSPKKQEKSVADSELCVKTDIENNQPNLTSAKLAAITSQVYPPINKRTFKTNFIKPVISNAVLQRRNRLKVEDENKTSESESESYVIPSKKDATDEKSTTVKHQFVTNDITYPPAPPSPSKINRGRIKVVPRFGQRRPSFSASESEDDNKKTNRIRNDSVCSTTSELVDQSYALECLHSPKKEFANVVQRKFRRTEQSRKLAEARRDFLQKFGTSKPDRQKLTMMDLIFYNPSGNPMSQKQKNKPVEQNNTENVVDVEKEQPEEIIITDEENEELPAPQIKVGPNGEITIDEKSLIVENKQVKRAQEKIKNSKLVDGDSVTTYGIYKKTKRTKLWSKKETLRFYKALNAIGTDFSLMLSLFPGRTRRDLTMKFKKEEKINRTLIDRALMVPNTYDITELKREMELEEREEKDKETIKREVQLLAKKKLEEKRKQKQEKSREKKQAQKPRKRSKSARKLYKDLNKGVNSFLDDESDADDESDTSVKTTNAAALEILQSKRKSLRPRKIRKIYTDPEESDEDELDQMETVTSEAVENVPERGKEDKDAAEGSKQLEKSTDVKEKENDPKSMEPGSLLVYSTTGSDGNPVYKFFMVAPVQGQQIDTQNKTILNIGTVRVEENITAPAEENNVTISEDEGVSNTPNCIIQQNIIIKPGTNCLNETAKSDTVKDTNEDAEK